MKNTLFHLGKLMLVLALGALAFNIQAQTAAPPTANTAAEVAKAKARVRTAERNYQRARDEVLVLREERDRVSRQNSADERRKIRTTTGFSKRADEYATEDVRNSRTDLNQVRREEARATSRLEDAKRELANAKQALAVAEQKARAGKSR